MKRSDLRRVMGDVETGQTARSDSMAVTLRARSSREEAATFSAFAIRLRAPRSTPDTLGAMEVCLIGEFLLRPAALLSQLDQVSRKTAASRQLSAIRELEGAQFDVLAGARCSAKTTKSSARRRSRTRSLWAFGNWRAKNRAACNRRASCSIAVAA